MSASRLQSERIRAIGSTTGLPAVVRRALEPGDHFKPVPEPGPHDWLANHPERGQTFDDFVRAGPNRPDGRRGTICFQPLDDFPADRSPPLDRLEEFAGAFFGMPVKILPVEHLEGSGVTTRVNAYTNQTQLLTGDILRLLKQKLPEDAFCLLGITMHDLYPDPSWNFVFGQASLRERVAVYSFARYDPRFHGEDTEGNAGLMLERSCKVLAHETAHMFGIEHCVHFHCLMNGSNHLEESDARPLHLCPVDLRKLYHSVRFDVVDRYRRLHGFCEAVGFDAEAEWLKARIEYLSGE